MNETAQTIAIAEACGWTEGQGRDSMLPEVGWIRQWKHPDTGTLTPNLPNYLNAMQEAVMSLPVNIRDLVNLKLEEITMGGFDHSETYDFDAVVNATAKQRAEAFLRTLNLWKD